MNQTHQNIESNYTMGDATLLEYHVVEQILALVRTTGLPGDALEFTQASGERGVTRITVRFFESRKAGGDTHVAVLLTVYEGTKVRLEHTEVYT